MNEQTQEQIVNCGAFYFSAEKTAMVIATDVKEQERIIKALKNDSSPERKLYETGKTRAEYEVMTKLFELARSGDIQAIKEFDRRTKTNIRQGF